jgi:endonuclease G
LLICSYALFQGYLFGGGLTIVILLALQRDYLNLILKNNFNKKKITRFALKKITVLKIIIIFAGFISLLFSCEPEQKKGLPKQEIIQERDTFRFLPVSTSGEVVHHKFYSLSYNEEYENAEWVAYSLSPKQLSSRQIKRPHFIRDPEVSTGSAHYKNYYPNGYEKGHLLPAADMRFNIDAFDDTFYTSNVSPMDHYFNAGIWNRLEKQVRYWVKTYGKLYIVTAGILQDGLERIGREKVAVPDYFYKIVLDYKKPGEIRMIGFIIPHKNLQDDLQEFVVPVDSIEKLTGIDFFPALPDDLEDKLEAEKHPEKWTFIHFEDWQNH